MVDPNFNSDFARFIRLKRKALNLYQSEVSKRVGMCRPWCHLIEIGDSSMQLDNAHKVLKVLGSSFTAFEMYRDRLNQHRRMK